MNFASQGRRVFAILGTLLFACQQPVRQSSAPPPSSLPPPAVEHRLDLVPGTSVPARMKGGETDAYLFYIDAGRYAGITVEQRGIDVVASLRRPDGRLLAWMDTPQGARVPEPIPFIAPVAGTYRLEVASEPHAAPGDYAVRIDALRPATPRDRTRVEAERLLAQGEKLRRSGGSRQAAVAPARQAALLFRNLSDPSREADSLYTVGKALASLNDHAGAREAYERALVCFREAGREREAGKVLNALGLIHRALGEPALALERHNEALAVNRSLGDREQQGDTLLNLGKAYLSRGETEEAFARYEEALALYREIGARLDEANTLRELGELYQRMGEPDKALDLLPRALALFKAEGALDLTAATLQSLGNARARAGQAPQALASLHRALALQRRLDDRRAAGGILNDLGACYVLQGRTEEARRSFAEALAVYQQIPDRLNEAATRTNLGLMDVKLGRPRQAVTSLELALPVLEEAGSLEYQALALLGLARAHRSLGELAAAQRAAEEAIDHLESLRSESASLSMRASFLASKQDYYGFYIDLLMDLDRREPGAGYDARALAVSEQARARSLLEMLGEAGADLRKRVDPELLAREADLARRIYDADARQRRLATPAGKAELRELLREQDRVQAEMRRESLKDAALPRPLTLPEIQQQVVDDGTLLLEYSLGRERSFLWAVTPGSLKSFELPPGDEIQEMATRAAASLAGSRQTRAREQARQALAELSGKILAPAAALLEGKRLVVVPDGALHYVPFAALPAPGSSELLVVRHEIVTLPSASSLAAIRRESRPPAPATLAVVADPVFDVTDPRVPHRTAEPVRMAAVRGASPAPMSRLHFSRQEATALLQWAPPAERLEVLDFDANRETVLSGRLGRYRLVHFATHGRLDTDNPELSGLYLSQVDPQGRPRDGDGFLGAHEIYRLSLPADLVVLSACRTALGREIRGEGLVGLTRGFFHAGARAVLVSLWEVDDHATAELMGLFYREMLQGGRPPAAALRIAQASLREKPGWKAPYFWAGFVLQGDWRPRTGR